MNAALEPHCSPSCILSPLYVFSARNRGFPKEKGIMKLLAVHPSGLMFTRIFLRLEPLGLELIAEAARRDGHEVRILDLQVQTHHDFHHVLKTLEPDAICFSGNYLANVPEIVDLAKSAKARLPQS